MRHIAQLAAGERERAALYHLLRFFRAQERTSEVRIEFLTKTIESSSLKERMFELIDRGLIEKSGEKFILSLAGTLVYEELKKQRDREEEKQFKALDKKRENHKSNGFRPVVIHGDLSINEP